MLTTPCPLLAAAVACTLGCGSASPPPPAPANPPEDRISLVTSSVVVESCPSARQLNTRLASKEIEEMLAPCTKVPGGSAHFSATLLPAGGVELGPPSTQPLGGMVPTCILQKRAQLRHRLKLKGACRFDVRLEER